MMTCAAARAALVAAATTGLLTACATQGRPTLSPEEVARQERQIESLSAGKPQSLKYHYRSLVTDGDADAVRNWLELGKAALNDGHRTVAAEAFDEALKRITAVYADDPQAEKARSVWHSEGVKDFKGEPHERAMAFVYRGLLDMFDGDYENARASFKAALIQDSFAELERHRQDFASAAWLVGWTSRCLGDATAAAEAFDEARGLRGGLPVPGEDDALLVLVEAGRGPSKEARGEHKEKLAYVEGTPPTLGYFAMVGQTRREAVLAEDLFQQATTRGGRQMDDVLAVKAGTKETTATVGAGATAAGVGMMAYGNHYNNNDAMAAGLIVALLGLAAQAAAEGMTAEADTRYWHGLPHSLFVAPMPLPAELTPSSVTVTFSDPLDDAVTDPDQIQTARHGSCGIAWFPTSSIRLSPAPRKTDEARGDASASSDGTAAGNCRTSTGTLKNLSPEICKGIDGTVLSDRPKG